MTKTVPQKSKTAIKKLGPVQWPEQTQGGAPRKGSMVNVRKAVQAMGLDVKLDVFTGNYIVEGSEMFGFVGELTDPVSRKFREVCYARLGYEPGAEAAHEGLLRACEEHRFNSVMNYLDGLKWDGVKRLNKWLPTYTGCKDTPLHRVWGRLVLLAAVARIYDPGYKFDHVLVLESGEGTDKSSLVQVLACGYVDKKAKYFSDSGILHKPEKEQMELTKGVWFYELAELAGMSRADQHAVKAFVTRQEDRGRAAYAHFKEGQPRCNIFIGTFNTDANTGEAVTYLNVGDRRRWWPLKTGKIDIKALIQDRDQLFAEAVHEYQVGVMLDEFSLRLPKEFWEPAAVVQKSREKKDLLLDKLAELEHNVIAIKSDVARAHITEKQAQDAERGTHVDDGSVWAASWYITDHYLPANLVSESGGNRVSQIMGSLGWIPKSRGHANTRGWFKERAAA